MLHEQNRATLKHLVQAECEIGQRPFRQKIATIIKQGGNHKYEVYAAFLLEWEKFRHHIFNWIPSEQFSPLDGHHVDMIALVKPNVAKTLQITSTGNHGRERRRKIERRYGSDTAVGVVQFVKRSWHVNRVIPVWKALQQITNAIHTSEEIHLDSNK